ncbi:porin [Crenobacter sp. SG2303]|uniref:Porin n=1 Tax=Crenobacter oryzisoli TaxID=3056844 RepID=A0ABT7XJV7_9NEIS|nr:MULTISPECIES: porin [unclassified Crenobacter]MDN0074069.1 porin [Crenobacter sp. SG2303]MDN0083996.1 porin [Crenobacter sp. SG2305]
MSNYKKMTYLAAALALPLAAHADVTIYGLMSAGVESTKVTGNGTSTTTGRVEDLNSRIGFKGNEDLGNGLKAIWQVESSLRNFEQGGTNDKNQSATFATRNTFVGLQDGDWGTVQLGLYDSAYKRMTTSDIGINLWHDTEGDLNPSSVNGVANRRNARLANSVHYTSPVWSGFQFGVSYGFDEQRPTATNGTRQNDDRFDVAAEYTSGGLKLGLGYDHEGDKLNSGATADGQQHINGAKAAGSYTFASTGTLIGASYERVKTSNNGTPDTTQDDWMVALSQPITGRFTAKLVYAQLGKLDGATNPDDFKAKQWVAGVTYDVSKRTQLFLYGTKILNNAQQNANFVTDPLYTSGIGTDKAALAKGADPQVFTLGMSHLF